MKNKLKWFEFTQNNTGGSFDVDSKLCHRLFIQAEDEADAVRIAEEMGVYFDGVHLGHDCPCCGDRWYFPNELSFPIKYTKGVVFKTPEAYAQHLANEYGWTGPDSRIFYKAGRVVEIVKEAKKKKKSKPFEP